MPDEKEKDFKRFAARIPIGLSYEMHKFVEQQQKSKGKGYSQNQLVLEAVAHYLKENSKNNAQ